MKETKKFFENNRLNKGYSKIANPNKTDMSYIRSQFKHVLPPIDLIAEYEELVPGTFVKLLDMAQSEQNHRHTLDLIAQEKYNRATIMGRYFALILVAMISLTTGVLALTGFAFVAIAFAASAFACIAVVSSLYSKNNANKFTGFLPAKNRKKPGFRK